MKIRLVEYKNIVDNNGQAFGHGKKVLYEAEKICQLAGYNTEIAACLEYKMSAYKESFTLLSNAINVAKYDYRYIGQIMSNLRHSQRKLEADIVWFTNIDWYLFLYLGICRKKSKIIVTTYSDIEDMIATFRGKGGLGRIVAKIMEKGIKKVDLVIETYYQENRRKNTMYMPDYLYTDYYKKFRFNKKNRRIICIGTMNVQKDLESMVKILSKVDCPVVIKGGFVDKQMYQKLLTMKTKNMDIQDCYLTDEDYYYELSKSEYVIVPYNMDIYGTATSGVVREALYMGVKVLAPQKLLDNMGIKIKGYTTIEDVISLMNEKQNVKEDDLLKYSAKGIATEFKEKLDTIL